MPEHVLETRLWLPRPRSEIFPFFADAANLGEITPPWLRFRILTPMPMEMRRGARLEYRISLHGVPMRWRTLISLWEPPFRFVDEQVRGPYRLWHHTHTFEEQGGGTLCRDRVRYISPGGPLVHDWFVRPRVERIFQYRRAALISRFGDQGVLSPAGGKDAMNASHSAEASAMSVCN